MNVCNELAGNCLVPNGTSCDDACSGSGVCTDGLCSGVETTLLSPSCRWIVLAGVAPIPGGITVKTTGVRNEGGSILDFAGQQGAGEGLLVTSDDALLTNFAVLNTKGDGIKSKGADRIVYHKLRVEWTAGPKETNGAYGIYPVESTDVLIDSVFVRGASDAGIYVGQSKNIIVRDSTAIENVAGIEIENSYDADGFRRCGRRREHRHGQG